MNKIKKIENQIEKIMDLEKLSFDSQDFSSWKSETLIILEKIFGKNSEYLEVFELIRFTFRGSDFSDDILREKYLKGLSEARSFLSKVLGELKQGNNENVEILENIFNKFGEVVNQLTKRHSGRETIQISDEYDVQDLLHGLFKLHFDDIRAEEWNPSYAGGSTRSDFLLKDEKIIIEVKKTREGLKDKDVGQQLIVDIANYKKHPDCGRLLCFVYDPDKIIKNPRGVEKDLENTEDLDVKVYIRN